MFENKGSMTDLDNVPIRPLNKRSDYNLRRIRVVAAVKAKGLKVTLSTNRDIDKDMDKMRRAINIIVGSLCGQTLRVVRTVVGNHIQLLEKLDCRYDS